MLIGVFKLLGQIKVNQVGPWTLKSYDDVVVTQEIIPLGNCVSTIPADVERKAMEQAKKLLKKYSKDICVTKEAGKEPDMNTYDDVQNTRRYLILGAKNWFSVFSMVSTAFLKLVAMIGLTLTAFVGMILPRRKIKKALILLGIVLPPPSRKLRILPTFLRLPKD